MHSTRISIAASLTRMESWHFDSREIARVAAMNERPRRQLYVFSALTMGTPLDLWCIRNVVTILTKAFAFLCGRQLECATRKVSRQVVFLASMACGAHIDCLCKMFALCGSSAFCFSTQVAIVYASLAARCTDSTRSGAFYSNFFFSLVFHRAIFVGSEEWET